MILEKGDWSTKHSHSGRELSLTEFRTFLQDVFKSTGVAYKGEKKAYLFKSRSQILNPDYWHMGGAL